MVEHFKRKCAEIHHDLSHDLSLSSDRFCYATHDRFLCWGPTVAGKNVSQICPRLRGFNPANFAYRQCGHDGQWVTWNTSDFIVEKTNFQECLILENQEKIRETVNIHKQVMENAKPLNILGLSLLSVSLLSICVAFFLYYVILPKFVNSILHVCIHKQLYMAVIFDAGAKIVFRIMVAIQWQTEQINPLFSQDVIGVCEALTTISQYAELAILIWVVLDARFIQITARSGQLCASGYLGFCLIGWGVPVVPTTIWVVTLTVSHKVKCWSGYSRLPVIWVMEIPKILCLTTALFLLCVSFWTLHVNVKKGKHLDERKIRHDIIMAGMFLLFILVSVSLSVIFTHAPMDNKYFVFCQYVVTILTSSRGLIMAICYTFLNKDVHTYVKYNRNNLPLKNGTRFEENDVKLKKETVCCDI